MSDSVNHLINHKAVCRTAPATPGLLTKGFTTFFICISDRFIILVSHSSPRHVHNLVIPLILPFLLPLVLLLLFTLPVDLLLLPLLQHRPFLSCPLSIIALVEVCLLPPTPESSKFKKRRRREDEEEIRRK